MSFKVAIDISGAVDELLEDLEEFGLGDFAVAVLVDGLDELLDLAGADLLVAAQALEGVVNEDADLAVFQGAALVGVVFIENAVDGLLQLIVRRLPTHAQIIKNQIITKLKPAGFKHRQDRVCRRHHTQAQTDQELLMSCLRISKSSGLAILPSPFLSMAVMNCLTSWGETSLLRPRLLKASVIRLKIQFSSRVPLLSVSYLSKMLSIACLSWSSVGLPLIANQWSANYYILSIRSRVNINNSSRRHFGPPLAPEYANRTHQQHILIFGEGSPGSGQHIRLQYLTNWPNSPSRNQSRVPKPESQLSGHESAVKRTSCSSPTENCKNIASSAQNNQGDQQAHLGHEEQVGRLQK